MRVVGGRSIDPVGNDQLRGRTSYFLGSDQTKWRTGVTSFARVRYREVLPGVDLVYRGVGASQVEYDVVVAPGISPDRVEFTGDGIDSIDVSLDGSAIFKLSGGREIRQAPVVAYQVGATGERTTVAARFEKRGTDALGFQVGPYDRQRELVLDPIIASSTLLGGEAEDQAFSIALSPNGDAVIAGVTYSTDFSGLTPFGALSGFPDLAGGDAFVGVLEFGGELLSGVYLSGAGEDYATDVGGHGRRRDKIL